MNDENLQSEIINWREARARRLAEPDGWLAAAGLFWLAPGENRLGGDPNNPILLPAGSAPAQAGVLTLAEDEIILQAEPGAEILISGQPISTRRVPLVKIDELDWIQINALKLQLLQRGERVGVRVFDPNHPRRMHFQGLRWFPIQEAYRVPARFIPSVEPETLSILNLLGDILELPCPGVVEFSINGEDCRLYPLEAEEGRLWFIFRDATSGELTYPAGRYLTADPPQEGQAILDFNKATNPPCAYTEHATCPLPPASNRLSVAITAGELNYMME